VNSDDLFDALQVQIWTADLSGALRFVNDYTAKYFGRTREQLVGEGWQNVLHAGDVPLAIERWSHALKTGEPYHVDFRLLRASDRTYRWHHASALRVEGDDGLLWVGSNIDIDAERRADEVLLFRQQMRGRTSPER
jgi:PAS domain S-box